MSITLPIITRLTLLIAAGALLLTAAGPANAQSTVTVPVGDIWFCDASFQSEVCQTEVTEGATITWDFTSATLPHTTTHCGASCDSPTGSPLWDSGIVDDGTFSFTFLEPGTYLYYCTVHPFQRGEIVVLASEPDAPPTQEPEPTNGSPGGSSDPDVVAGPVVGTGAGDAGSSLGWAVAAATAAGFALVSAGFALSMRRR